MENEPTTSSTSPIYQAVRVFGAVVLLLIVVAVLYSGWAMLANWGDISV